MKNKKITFLMLPLVIAIWALVIYQFFSYPANDDPIYKSEMKDEKGTITPQKRENFILDKNRKDPFLGKLPSSPEAKKMITAVKQSCNSKSQKNKKIWPLITYKGIVSDDKEHVKVFMLIINEKTQLLKIGESFAGVKLEKGNKESVWLKFEGELILHNVR